MTHEFRVRLSVTLLSLLIINPLIMGFKGSQEQEARLFFPPLTRLYSPGFREVPASLLTAAHTPAIDITITGPERAVVGEEITYLITITNNPRTGDGSPIREVSLLDDLGRAFVFVGGDINNNNLLEVNEDWQYERPMKIQADDPELISLTVYVYGVDQDGEAISNHESIQLNIGYNPHIELIVVSNTVATIGETVNFQITVTNRIVTEEIQRFDFSGFHKYHYKDPGYGSGFIKDYALVTHTRTRSGKLRDELIITGVITLAAALIGWVLGGIFNLIQPKWGSKVLVFSIVVGILTGIGYAGTTHFGWWDNLVKKSQLPSIPTLMPTSIPIPDETTKVITIGDGSPIHDIAVSSPADIQIGFVEGDTNQDEMLNLDENWLYQFSYTVERSDPEVLVYPVTVSALDRDGDLIALETNLTLEVEYKPVITIQKTGPDSAHLGERLTYGFTLTNDPTQGDGSPLEEVLVTDGIAGLAAYAGGDLDEDTLLEVGETWVYTVTHVFSANDQGLMDRQITVTGQDQEGKILSYQQSYPFNVGLNPVLQVFTSGPETSKVGDNLSFTIEVSHEVEGGDGSPIHNLAVTDGSGNIATYKSGDRNANGILEVDERWIFEYTHTVQVADPDPIQWAFSASGEDQDGDPIQAETTHRLSIDYEPGITLQVSGPDSAVVGDLIIYQVTVFNDPEFGDGSPVEELKVTGLGEAAAPYIRGDSNQNKWLDSQEQWFYELEYTLQESDPDLLEITLSVSGVARDGEPVQGATIFDLIKLTPFSNGDFELDEAGWVFQNNGLAAKTILSTPTGDEDIPLGSFAALLGNPEIECNPTGVPLGYAEIRRDLSVPLAPSDKHVGLQFNYVIYSQDVSTRPLYDRFEVYINDISTPFFSDGNQVNANLGCNVWWRVPGPLNARDGQTSGWATGFIDLDRFQGQTIQVSFQNHNRYDGWYNTYTYLDNVEVVIVD